MTDLPPNPGRDIPADYTVAELRGNAVSLYDLFKANLIATQQPLIRGKTFIDCRIEGPAVMLALNGVAFDDCDLGVAGNGDPRSLILKPLDKDRVTGAIGFENCRFQRCYFFGVGYTGSDRFIDHMIKVLDPHGAS